MMKEGYENIEILEEKIESINNTMIDILSAIKGNSITGDGGLVNQIKLLDKKIENQEIVLNIKISSIEKRLAPIEMFMHRAQWTIFLVGGVCAIIGTIVGLVTSYFSLIKK